jgi:AraC-like DNA-binding protein
VVAQKIVEKSIITPINLSMVSMYNYIPVQVVFLSRPVLVLGYLLWSAGLLLRYKMHRMESMVLQQQHFMKKWLWILLGFLFILVLSHSLQLIETFASSNTAIFNTLNLLQIFSGVGLTGLLLSPFFFPDILYGLPRFPQHSSAPVIPDEKPEDLSTDIHKSKMNLETDYLVFIQQKADLCMEEFQPYLQQDCNLAYFSKICMIPAHHLAYYFREIKKQSFNEYRNEWRIKHAKNLIMKGKARELTIEGIGLLSGFSTRNTFFTSFKKIEGVSPGAFLTQITSDLFLKS